MDVDSVTASPHRSPAPLPGGYQTLVYETWLRSGGTDLNEDPVFVLVRRGQILDVILHTARHQLVSKNVFEEVGHSLLLLDATVVLQRQYHRIAETKVKQCIT